MQDADFGLKTNRILYLRSTVKKINNQAIRVPHLAKPQNVSGNAKPKQGTMKPELKRIRKVEYDIDPNRYELRSGSETNATLCPYGNIYKWVVFDLKANEYVRFAKSVFKLLINKNGK